MTWFAAFSANFPPNLHVELTCMFLIDCISVCVRNTSHYTVSVIRVVNGLVWIVNIERNLVQYVLMRPCLLEYVC